LQYPVGMQKLITVFIIALCVSSLAEERKMSFHLLSEPHSLDPAHIRGSTGSYLLSNLFRGLYSFHSKKGLHPTGARYCTFIKPTLIECDINPNHKWSNGNPITTEDYIRTFTYLVNPKSKTVQWELLRGVKNAEAVVNGEKDVKSLGVKKISLMKFQIELEKPDPEFLYNFISPALSPRRKNQNYDPLAFKELKTSGPYVIKSWKLGSKITLTPNLNFPGMNSLNPEVDIYFVEDDTTAMNLYDKKVLNFLRRVEVSAIPAMQGKPDFIQIPMSRMDYLGFGPELKDLPKFRQALALSLNYSELAKIYHALGRPGCPSLPKKYYGTPICYDFNLQKAKVIFAQLPKEVRNRRWKLYYGKQGGESIKKGMEWIQSQWKRHLGISIELQPSETGMYIAQLTKNPPDLFRKGVGMDRPTCKAGLEIYTEKHRENYIQYKNRTFDSIVNNMPSSGPSAVTQCRKALQILMDDYALIPMGEIHFSLRVRPHVLGWDLNEMNQLDLSELRVVPRASKNP